MSIPRYFDIDSSDYVPNQSIQEFEWYPYNEDSNNVVGSTRYSIQTKNKGAMMRLAQARLEVKCRLVTAAGAAPTSATNANIHEDPDTLIAPINSAWHLFSNVRALLNNQEIYNSPYTGKEHLIRHLVHYDKEYAKTVGSQVIFYPDTATDNHEYANANPIIAGFKAENGKIRDVGTAGSITGSLNKFLLGKAGANTVTTARDNPDFNSGYLKRYKLFNTRERIKDVTLWLPISEVIPFFADYDRLMTGVTFQLILNKNTNHQSYLYGDRNGEDLKIDIRDIKLWVPEIKPSIEVAPELTEKFMSSSRSIIYRDVVGYRSPTYAGGGTGSRSWNVATTISKPLKAYVAFQFINRDSQYALNGGEFEMLFKTIGIRVNGQYLPNTKLDVNPDEATGSYDNGRILQEIHRAGGKDIDSDDSAIITKDNWPKIYPIVVFDLEDKAEGLFKNNLAHVVLEWTEHESKDQAGASPAPPLAGLGDYHVYMILETERGLKLDYAQSRLNVLFK